MCAQNTNVVHLVGRHGKKVALEAIASQGLL